MVDFDDPSPRAHPQPKSCSVPLSIKLAYAAFLCVYVPFSWQAYGPANFLWLCDASVLLAGGAVFLENRLLASMTLLATTIPFALWTGDLLGHLVRGHSLDLFAGYMFDPTLSLVARLASLFHLWLPPLLLWVVLRLGYDRRAWIMQTVLTAGLLLLCRLITLPPPMTSPVSPTNVNWVFGPAGGTSSITCPAGFT